jgi:hypothetical protein
VQVCRCCGGDYGRRWFLRRFVVGEFVQSVDSAAPGEIVVETELAAVGWSGQVHVPHVGAAAPEHRAEPTHRVAYRWVRGDV